MTSLNMQPIIAKIKSYAKEFLPDIIAIRHHLHQHPELSFQEYTTSAFICGELDKLGIEYSSNWVKTGIVAHIHGRNSKKKTTALRADLDALPIQEENQKSYCSKKPGVMHACGHDVHTACLLGAARILTELKESFEGTVRLIFQPGEEKLPGGASLMIQAGVLKDPVPNSIIGQHVAPQLQVGEVGFRSGMYMASADELYLTVYGKGGHAALPEHYNNPILIASKILLRLQESFMSEQVLSFQDRSSENKIPTVLAFGKYTAAGATNVIPDKVSIEGTFRTFDEAWRHKAHDLMKTIAHEIALENGGSCDFRIELGYPFLTNDHQVTQVAKEAAIDYLGAKNVIDLELRMTSEDFAFYSQQVPACFYRLGTSNQAKNITSNVHTSTFDVDENAMEIGSGLMAFIAISELSTN